MKKIKYIISVILSMVFVFAIAGCFNASTQDEVKNILLLGKMGITY